jgi:hypothetical protein
MDYNELLKAELEGVYGDQLQRVSEINRMYAIYSGDQKWSITDGLDYVPTQKVTNYIKKIVNTRARFMFGKEPYFDIRSIYEDEKGATTYQDQAQEKEDLLHKILDDNKFQAKLLKARKDCSIGGKVAIKLWGHKEQGVRIIFSPAQEFFPQYNIDDVDQLEKVVFLYAMNNEQEAENQRIKKQVWELVELRENQYRCILNESTHNGKGETLSVEYQDYNTELDFIPVIIIQNGGLTGETEGVSDVLELWPNQDAYNKLTSDDIDALKFQMFGQDVVTDADEQSLKDIKIAPGAMIDLQTDVRQGSEGRQARMERLESGFSYKAKFEDTIGRIKNDMYDLMDVPNVSLEELKGVIQSGKSMKALYWGLKAVCEEDASEWLPALRQMVEYIFKMVDAYNVYGARQIAGYETTTNIELTFPLQEDEDVEKGIDMQEVVAEVRSRSSYMKKWGGDIDIDAELEQIQREKAMLQDSYTQDLNLDIEEGTDPLEE